MILGSTYFTANEKAAQTVRKSITEGTKKRDSVYEKSAKSGVFFRHGAQLCSTSCSVEATQILPELTPDGS